MRVYSARSGVMTPPSASASRASRVMLGVLLVLSLLLVLVPSTSADATDRLGTVLSARFDAGEHTGIIAVTVSPEGIPGATSTPPPALPVTFTASCTDAAPCENSTRASWDFGDGTRRTTEQLATLHQYRTPGVYTATVRVETPQGVGADSIQVLVSPRYADVDVDLSDRPGRADRAAVWAASALGLLPPCRTAFPANDNIDPGSTAVHRGVFCPEPSAGYGPSVPPSMPAAAVNNGLTGASCLSSWDACGLPASVFAASANGNPRAACNDACQEALKSGTAPRLEADNRLRYDPLNCLDGWTASLTARTWSIVPGTEPGCVTRGEFFRSLVIAIDGPDASPARLAAPNDTTFCVDPPTGTGAFEMRRAHALGIPVTRERSGTRCDANHPITKSEAYRALAKTSGLPPADPASLRDLQDVTLGNGGAAHPDKDIIGAVLAKGGALVGSSACASGGGSCFVPEEAVTRSQLGVLFSGLFVGMPTLASGIRVGVVPATNPTPVNQAVVLTVQVRLPASYPAGSPLTVHWPPASAGISSRACSDTTAVTVDASRQATASCPYTRELPGMSAVTVRVTDAAGNAASATVPLVASDSAPRLDATNMAVTNEDTAVDTVVGAFDAEGTPLTYQVRSFVPGAEDPGTYPITKRRATTSWGTTAEVALGKVSILSSTPTSVTLRLAPDANAYGSYSFALQACDLTTCTVRPVTGTVNPVNDLPLPLSEITVTGSGNLSFTVGGTDPSDVDREGYPAGPVISLYRVDVLPANGTLRIDSDPGPGVTLVAASVGATTNNPAMRWDPDFGALSGDRSFYYSVRDAGHPTTAWSASSGHVWLRYSAL